METQERKLLELELKYCERCGSVFGGRKLSFAGLVPEHWPGCQAGEARTTPAT